MNTIQKNRITQSIIVGLTTFTAALGWTGLRRVLYEDGSWAIPFIFFYIWLVFLGLTWILAKSKPILLISLSAILIAFLLSFGFSVECLVGIFIAFLLFIFGTVQAVGEKNVRIKFRVVKILQHSLPHVLTALSLLVALAYYSSPMALTGESQIEIPRPIFDKLVEPLIESFEVGEIPSLPSAQDLNTSMLLDTSLEDTLYQTANQTINRYATVYSEYLAIGMAISIFFTVKMIGFLLMWLVISVIWVIFKLLLYFGAMKIQEQSVLKEVIEV